MLENGYIKLYRSLLTWEWYRDRNTCRLFLHLLLTVNYRPEQWKGREVARGQRVATIQKLADETGLSVREVRTALNHLKKTGEVTSESHSQYTLLTVLGYDRFQGETNETTNDRQTSDKPETNERQQRKKARKKENANRQLDSSGGFDVGQYEQLVRSYIPRYRGKRRPDGG